ncbi:aminoglycoside 6-adenylyltransferase [Nocardia xishanensis]|uniref:aminoglycoside 6-adenylyltransferase n=1 Tax=Nocardia xishanensis TaxID=238964 RepID=UPI0034089549
MPPKRAHHRRAGQLGIGSRLQPESHLARRNSAPWYGRPRGDAGELLAAVVGRARRDDRITALGQTGSRDRGDRVDRYSDLDLEIITPHRPEVFADRWPHRFGDVPPAVSFEDDEEAADRWWPAPGVAASRAVAAGAQALRPHRCRRGPAGAGCPGRSVRRCRGPARFPWHGEVVEGMRRLLAEDRTHR